MSMFAKRVCSTLAIERLREIRMQVRLGKAIHEIARDEHLPEEVIAHVAGRSAKADRKRARDRQRHEALIQVGAKSADGDGAHD